RLPSPCSSVRPLKTRKLTIYSSPIFVLAGSSVLRLEDTQTRNVPPAAHAGPLRPAAPASTVPATTFPNVRLSIVPSRGFCSAPVKRRQLFCISSAVAGAAHPTASPISPQPAAFRRRLPETRRPA